MKYFDHDTEAYKDDKIVLLRQECGGAAIDAYWTLLEVIYRDETEIKPTENRFGFASVCFFLGCSEEQLNEWIEAMVKYGLLDKTEDENGTVSITSPRAEETINGYRDRCSKNKANGGKGGRPKKTPVQNGRTENSKTDPKPNENREETEGEPSQKQTKPNRGDKEKEKEKEKENNKPPISPSDVFDDIASDDYADNFASFSKEVLEMYNAETGDGILYFDGTTWGGLRRSFDAGRTIEDLRLVVRDKIAEWGNDAKMKRFIRPSTLFGEKFEGYLAKARKAEKEAGEFDDYE